MQPGVSIDNHELVLRIPAEGIAIVMIDCIARKAASPP
jgi:hypothetical protein